ncbi:hypothetical protein NHH73_10465 [Oxalobacteraceae bacterium OTU3CINTB1]|nr:hypothetical protein NHH73_10465 [Oxalobacteraceae bacterium OTU3CINTB1]
MSDNKFDDAVLKMLKLTHLGVLSWVKESPPQALIDSTDSVISSYFESEYHSRKLALFHQRRRRTGMEEYLAKNSLVAMFSEDDKWVEIDRLVLLHDDGEIAYSFPPSRVVRDLLQTVRHKTSGIDQFLDELLNTEP